jgi:OmpA-OmpF porin, OOP family
MRCNFARWIWGIFPVLVMSALAAIGEAERLEADLKSRSEQALREAGLAWAALVFTAREAVLLGQAPDDSDQRAAIELVGGLWGVRSVEDRSGLIDVATNYVWSASLRAGNRLRITGHVPSDQRRREIIGVARATFPGREVDDRMKLARGAPEQGQWLGGISFGLNQLARLKTGGRVELDGAALAVEGEAEDAGAYKSITAALANALPRGIRLGREKVLAPPVRPFTLSAVHQAHALRLAGHVPGERQRKALLETAARVFPRTEISDGLALAGGEPREWETAFQVLLTNLARLEEGSVDMRDDQIRVTGVAADERTAELVRGALRSDVPAAFKTVEQITPAKAGGGRENEVQPPLAAPVAQLAPISRIEVATIPAKTTRVDSCQVALRSALREGVILFEFSSADLDPTSLPALDRIAALAATCPAARIEIAGHTDAEGSEQRNQELSDRRAQAVLEYLAKAGVSPSRLKAVGYGEGHPAAANDTAAGRAKNRRAEFSVTVN